MDIVDNWLFAKREINLIILQCFVLILSILLIVWHMTLLLVEQNGMN